MGRLKCGKLRRRVRSKELIWETRFYQLFVRYDQVSLFSVPDLGSIYYM